MEGEHYEFLLHSSLLGWMIWLGDVCVGAHLLNKTKEVKEGAVVDVVGERKKKRRGEKGRRHPKEKEGNATVVDVLPTCCSLSSLDMYVYVHGVSVIEYLSGPLV